MIWAQVSDFAACILALAVSWPLMWSSQNSDIEPHLRWYILTNSLNAVYLFSSSLRGLACRCAYMCVCVCVCVCVCITESLCPTAEKNTSIVHRLYLNEINLRKRWPILYYKGSQIFLGWRKEWLPTPVFWLGEFHGQRRLAGYSPWGHKESDTTEWLSLHRWH